MRADSPTSRSSRRMGTVLVAGVQPRSMSEEPVRSGASLPFTSQWPGCLRFERNRAHVHRESHTDAARPRLPIAVAQDVVVPMWHGSTPRGSTARPRIRHSSPLSMSHAYSLLANDAQCQRMWRTSGPPVTRNRFPHHAGLVHPHWHARRTKSRGESDATDPAPFPRVGQLSGQVGSEETVIHGRVKISRS